MAFQAFHAHQVTMDVSYISACLSQRTHLPHLGSATTLITQCNKNLGCAAEVSNTAMPGAAKAAHRGALIVLWADRVVGQGDVVQIPEGSIVQLHVGTRLGVVEVHDHGGGARRQEVR